MIEGLLVLSRLGTHGGEFTEVDLNETFAAVCEDLREEIASSGAVVSVETLPTIRADAEQMKLLFLSMVDNAIKFQEDDATPSVRVFVEAATGPTDCRIVVEDNGIGLDEQYADRVFTVFQRLHPRDVYPGLGLGLAYCRRIIDRHQGSIELGEATGGGTRFTVTLPT